ncbi:MAG: hypothetical protein IT168_04540, partial [Bryobacterales bacterium]|nr:hypothetical protein [Bryobacterales bacterium]
MASDAQIRANRENAKKSTGPRTPEGKRISSCNATRHGAWATYSTLHQIEGGQDLAKLHDILRRDIRPHGASQELLVEQLASIHHRIRRYQMVEARVTAQHMVDGGNWALAMARDYNVSHDSIPKMAAIIARLHREFRQTLKAIREEQQNEPDWLVESYQEREAAGEFKTNPIPPRPENRPPQSSPNVPPQTSPEAAPTPPESVEHTIK